MVSFGVEKMVWYAYGGGGAIALFALGVCGSVAPAANAHQVDIAGEVAGTWHIEPNHNPKAGETVLVWIALTRQGGERLPLAEANCELAVYAEPRQPGDAPILQPLIKAIDAEQYQGIPGADVVFPKVGLYELELSCEPKEAEHFQPFQMQYSATVATAGVTNPEAKPTHSPAIAPDSTPPIGDRSWAIPAGIIAGAIGLVGGIGWIFRQRNLR
jgi:hypothetical protein